MQSSAAEFAERAMARRATQVNAEMKSGLLDLVIVTRTAPLIGLLGAVLSIYEGLRPWGSPAWQGLPQVAGGLLSASECLLAGLSVALLANMCHRFLQAQANVFQSEMANQSHDVSATLRPSRQLLKVAPLDFVERAMQRTIKQVDLALRARLHDLATVAAVAPLLGVSGAVYTISRECFQFCGSRSCQLSLTTGGAADSLIWILVSTAIAVSASIGYRYFCNQAKDLHSEMQSASLLLLNQLPS